jgi:hypothetical protein
MPDSHEIPHGLDSSAANVARILYCYLGGNKNYAAGVSSQGGTRRAYAGVGRKAGAE